MRECINCKMDYHEDDASVAIITFTYHCYMVEDTWFDILYRLICPHCGERDVFGEYRIDEMRLKK